MFVPQYWSPSYWTQAFWAWARHGHDVLLLNAGYEVKMMRCAPTRIELPASLDL